MAKAGGNTEIFNNRRSIGGESVESGSIIEQVGLPIQTSLERMEDRSINSDHVEDIDKWASSLEKILDDVPAYMCSRGHPGRVSRIPENLRQVDVKGYEPYILSIGPYHNGKPNVQHMEMRKKLALKGALEHKPDITLRDYLREIASAEQTARSFYLDVNMDSEKFVQMLLLDSVHIVTSFCRLEKSSERFTEINAKIGSKAEDEDPNVSERQINEDKRNGDYSENRKVLAREDESNDEVNIGENWYWAMFAHDIFLIENQIPFFILQMIYSLAFGGSGKQFLEIMKYEIANLLTYYTNVDPRTVIVQTEEVHHLLHLCHMLFIPTLEQESTSCHFPESGQMFRLGSAVQLYEAGVHFESRSDSSKCSLLDITFDRSGKLTVPCLHVDHNTESLLRNLIALEQMKYPNLGLNISAYIVLLLHLITVPKDVELLRRKGIIQHHLASDKEMMYLINRLSLGLAFDYLGDKYSLKQVFQELKRYSERKVPQWKACLKHRHFSNPWTTISLFVASFLLILTVVQTYYVVYSYYYPYYSGHS